jgi:hypothetical protein
MRKAMLFILLIFLSGVVLWGQAGYRVTPDSVVAPFRAAKWREISTWRALSENQRRTLGTIGVALAEKGSDWNATDVSRPKLLSRRFVVVGVTSDRIVLVYEHGDFAPHQHVVCFIKTPKGYTVLANVSTQGVRTTKNLPKALTVGNYWSAMHY